MRFGLFFVSLIALTGCVPDRVAPLDWCAKEGRKIPHRERILKTLAKAVKDFDGNGPFLPNGPNHFGRWQAIHREKHPNWDANDLAERYLTEFPTCCVVLPPAFLDHTKVSDHDWFETIEESTRRYPDNWVVDVRIWHKVPHNQDSVGGYLEYAGSACNDVRQRGANGEIK